MAALTTDLSDRYAWAVARHVPPALRADINADVRALIEAAVARQDAGDPLQAEREALIELGDPHHLAAAYTGSPQHLIGPAFYFDYIRLIKLLAAIVLPIAALAISLPLIIATPDDHLAVLAGTAWGTAMVAIQLLFWTTLVFVLLDRHASRSRDTRWRPEQLPRAGASSQRADAAFSVLAVAALIVFLVWQQLARETPFVDPELWRAWLPIILGLAVLMLVLQSLRLARGAWTTPLGILHVLADVALLATVAHAATRSSLINPAYAEQAGVPQASPWIIVTLIGAFIIGDIIGVIADLRRARASHHTPTDRAKAHS
ncbi:hypothetical protein HT102_11600 [Hoyosella sp. G463]|uniref:Uncharacterized protein n=1 Tax=Lolliginicoccus lacisalsi TaxID=2742202 RepID=A0A927JDB1_9ACTN|nr:hypothetical protein [Lolliginicoccus lacisalsi]MBD8507134.1 hypothetical protein [Lolliginicoccus lacisalsi]